MEPVGNGNEFCENAVMVRLDRTKSEAGEGGKATGSRPHEWDIDEKAMSLHFRRKGP